MLKKKYRLKKNWQFQENLKRGKRKISKNFLCFFLEKKIKNCLFGISVPKKIIKKATKRNYYKRQIGSMINSILKNKKSLPEINRHCHGILTIVITNNYEKNSFLENEKELKKIIKSYER